jgi:hypothetical protein
MADWSALVHGRTYREDFRTNLIVIPEDFGREEIDWAKRYILATTASPERLRDGPRWSVFKSRRHCVVGVTCLAEAVSDNMIRDEHGRPVYVFLGYVARTPFPPLPPRELARFRPLYQFVRERWDEKGRQAHGIRECGYYEDALSEISSACEDEEEPPRMNVRETEQAFWIPADAGRLWTAVSVHPGPISLCLGLASRRDAEEGPFDHVTVADVREPARMVRPSLPRSSLPPPASAANDESVLQSLVSKGVSLAKKGVGFLSRSEPSSRQARTKSDRRAAPPVNPLAGFKYVEGEPDKDAHSDESESRRLQQRPPPTDGNAPPPEMWPGFAWKEPAADRRNQEDARMEWMDGFDPGMQLTDMNGDGLPDAATQVLDANGDGLADSVLIVTEHSSMAIEAVDLDGDLYPDASLVSQDLNHDGLPDRVDVGPPMFQPEGNLDPALPPADWAYGVPVADGLPHFDPRHGASDLVGEPAAEMENWHQQANPDTCAVVSQEFILESLTGREFSEAQLQQEAWRMGAYTPGGGTPLECMGDLLEAHGIGVEREYGATLDELSAKLNEGSKVMVALDSHEIWTPGQDYVTDELLTDCVGLPGQQADHAVEVIGIDHSDPNHPMVILNDPGHPQGGGLMVPADEFVNAWQDSNCYMVSTV